MARGWVYVITNPAMPGLVKIGYSLKDPLLRAKELNHTGAPHPYVVRYDALVHEPRNLEQVLHQRLEQQREGKEWFRISVLDAVQHIRLVAADKILLESGATTGGSVAGEEQEQEQQLDLCDYKGCNLEAERNVDGRRYCLWHAREVRNPQHAAAIRRLREEQEQMSS